jgi:hypothetical protein
VIASAGSNPRDRQEVVAKLGGKYRMLDLSLENLTNTQNALLQAQFKLRTLNARYGKDHPLVTDAQAQVDFLDAIMKETNPGYDPKVKKDDLDRIKSFLENRQKFLKEHVGMVEFRMKEDLKLGILIGILENEHKQLKEKLQKTEVDIREAQDKRNRYEVAKLSAGTRRRRSPTRRTACRWPRV